ncbi:MAG: NADH-quinone oxidoreductase subunit NuoE [Bacteroidales bacterium]|jgi:NADH-quinone oxidoreductase subunit E|nr:NADH-quinone oxidoreductase subunit NuoE [Bacteroidales bacterium]
MTDVKELIQAKVKCIGAKREALMPILQAIVEEKNYLNEEDMIQVAEALDLSTADVYGTATFYTFLDTVPRGKYVIRVCKTISCHMAGKDEIVDTLKDLLKVDLGETTPDKNFTLMQANCMGWCHKGPVMLVNDDIYTELTKDKVIKIIHDYMGS